MGTGPKPYQVVYDTDNGLQYVFESGNVAISTGGTSFPAVIALTGQAADIAGAAFFTASTAGMYRVNFYGICVTSDAEAGGSVTMSFSGATFDSAQFTNLDLTSEGSIMSGTATVVLGAGDPVTYSITGGGTYGDATYNLNLTAEILH